MDREWWIRSIEGLFRGDLFRQFGLRRVEVPAGVGTQATVTWELVGTLRASTPEAPAVLVRIVGQPTEEAIRSYLGQIANAITQHQALVNLVLTA